MAERKMNLAGVFGCALAGIFGFVRTQRNARIQIVAAIAACAMGVWLRISRMEWAILTLTIALVLVTEAINTAIEKAVDLAMPQEHELAKFSKDVAAGAVLIAAAASVVVGVILFAPRIWIRLLR